MMQRLRLLDAGEQGLIAEFGTVIDEAVNIRVHRLAKQLAQRREPAILEIVPTYRSLLVYFDPLRLSRDEVGAIVRELDGGPAGETEAGRAAANVVSIPVCYGGEYGPDLEFVADHNGLSAGEVIAIHSSVPYLVYMLGFTPGFPYLGGMDEKIACPRLEKPRVRIPAGSVGIAGSQTGFYPVESPGGWRLIGRTPIEAFDPQQGNPFLFAAGDYLRFKPVSADEFSAIRREVEAGVYVPEVTSLPRGDK